MVRSSQRYMCTRCLKFILYCPFAYKWRVILLTHCPQIFVRKEISRPGFLDVSRYSVVHSIDFRRVFLCHVNISIRIFENSVSCPGLYDGLYGQNLPYKFKNLYCDFWNRNFEKSHRTSGPRSDLILDPSFWENSVLETTFGNNETSKPEVFGRWP
jgi:hypothetical protein